jgi:glycosyltransferase involved in cell wall biosynthesis
VPRVSVLLPVRDAADTLPECLESLAVQTLEDHEVVAIDDGSTDGSGSLLAEWAGRDRRLRVVRTPRRGLVPALNRALAEARSSVVARMDADDLARRDRLERQVDRLEHDPGVDVLGSRVELFSHPALPPSGGMRAHVDWLNGLLDHEAMARDRFVEAPLVHPSVVLRRAALHRLGGWRSFDGPEDYDLWLRAFDAGLRFSKLPEVLLLWRDRPGRLTRTDPRYSPDRFRALKLAALRRGPLVPGRPVVIWGAGPVGKGWARALAAVGHPVSAFVEVDRRKVGERIHGARVVPVAEARQPGRPLHLAAVGQRGARGRIRAEAARLGLHEGRDLVAVA